MAFLENVMATRRIAIIPARAGSKRIKNKNIKPFFGKPILAYAIECAKATKLFDEIVVSTDSAHIAAIAQEFGALTPFVRPQSLSGDKVATLPVISHALKELDAKEQDLACCIYPATPLLESQHLQNAYNLLVRHKDISYVFGAQSYAHNPLRAFKLEHSRVKPLDCQYTNLCSQDIETIYHDAGQFYFGRASAFLAQLPIFAPHSFILELGFLDAQDIDTLSDWELAEFKYCYKHNLTRS